MNKLKLGHDGSYLLLLDQNNKPLPGQSGITYKDHVDSDHKIVTVEFVIDGSEIIDLRSVLNKNE